MAASDYGTGCGRNGISDCDTHRPDPTGIESNFLGAEKSAPKVHDGPSVVKIYIRRL